VRDVTIKVTRNGSYRVSGPITLLDAEGNPYTLEDGDVWLCRCGQSENKPFCDSSHRRVGFESVVLADGDAPA
jgi:CDGSH-type Zn-finger protein